MSEKHCKFSNRLLIVKSIIKTILKNCILRIVFKQVVLLGLVEFLRLEVNILAGVKGVEVSKKVVEASWGGMIMERRKKRERPPELQRMCNLPSMKSLYILNVTSNFEKCSLLGFNGSFGQKWFL